MRVLAVSAAALAGLIASAGCADSDSKQRRGEQAERALSFAEALRDRDFSSACGMATRTLQREMRCGTSEVRSPNGIDIPRRLVLRVESVEDERDAETQVNFLVDPLPALGIVVRRDGRVSEAFGFGFQ